MNMSYYGFLLSAMLLAPFANVDADEKPRFVVNNELHIDESSGKCLNKNGDLVFTDPFTGETFDKNGDILITAGKNSCDNLYAQWAKRPPRMWECVLDKMPAVQNDLAARITYSECKKLHGNERTTTRSFSVFGPSTRSECAQKYTAGTSSLMAARSIFAACNALYEK